MIYYKALEKSKHQNEHQENISSKLLYYFNAKYIDENKSYHVRLKKGKMYITKIVDKEIKQCDKGMYLPQAFQKE